jgi:hypothetical protein
VSTTEQTPTDRAAATVMTKLAELSAAELAKAETLQDKAPRQRHLIAMHQADAEAYALLHAEVSSGLLDRLRAGVL